MLQPLAITYQVTSDKSVRVLNTVVTPRSCCELEHIAVLVGQQQEPGEGLGALVNEVIKVRTCSVDVTSVNLLPVTDSRLLGRGHTVNLSRLQLFPLVCLCDWVNIQQQAVRVCILCVCRCVCMCEQLWAC